MLKKFLITVFVVAIAGIFCTEPVRITDEQPQVMDSGYRLARQLIFGLQSLRTIHDIQEVTRPIPFSNPLLDSITVSIRQWNPTGVSMFFNPSLAKTRASQNVFAVAEAQFAQSIASADKPVIDPDSIIDSALALGDSTFITVYRLKAGVLDTPWTAGYDSLYWRIAAGDTDTVSLIRTRTTALANIGILDHIAWLKSSITGWKFLDRRQSHYDTLTLRATYMHMMWINNSIVYDTLINDHITRKEFVYIIRRDNSADRWNVLDSSAIYGYTDSLWTADSTVSVAVANADSDSTVFDFKGANAQTVKTHTVIRREQAKTWLLEDITVRLKPLQPDAVVAYGQTIARDLLDTTSYLLSDIDTSLKTASLYIRVKPLIASVKDTTEFGLRTETQYHFSINFSAGWDALSYSGMDRTDFVAGPDSILRVDWTAGATDILPSLSRLTVKVTYKTSHPTTAYRIWTRAYPDTLTYLWVGDNGDSTQVRWKYGTNAIAYKYNEPYGITHGGSLSWLVDSQAVDTLRSLVNPGILARSFTGHYAGDTGSFKVYTSQYIGERDSFSLRFINDSFIVVSPYKVFLPDSLAWLFVGKQWSMNFGDSTLAVDIRYRFSMDFSGLIIGAMDAVNRSAIVTYWSNSMTLGIEGLAAAKLFGVVTGDPKVSANLNIDIWNESSLENSSLFQ